MKRTPVALVMAALLILASSTVPVGTVEAGSLTEEINDECTMGHSLLLSITNTAGVTDNALGCTLFEGETEVDTIDTNETKQDLIERTATSNEHASIYLDSMGNYLQDTKSIARLEAQAAYYRALDNGSSESAARLAAEEAVKDYYHVKQYQLVQSYNVLLISMDAYEQVEGNENLSNNFVQFYSDGSTTDGFSQGSNSTFTTTNGTDLNFSSIDWTDSNGYDNSNDLSWYQSYDDREVHFLVGQNDDSVGDVQTVNISRYHARLVQADQQEADVIAEMDTFINNTYDAYQAGEVNATDLIDANTFDREFSPEDDFQSWATVALGATEGVDPPDHLDGVGHFDVTFNGGEYTGLLLADGQEVGTWENGTVYNGTQMNVTPRLVTDSSVYKLDGEFSIQAIETASGDTRQNVTVNRINYTTTNTTEYKELLEDYKQVRAELAAREDKLNAGGGLLGGLGGGPSLAIILLIAAAALMYRDKKQSPAVNVHTGRKGGR